MMAPQKSQKTIESTLQPNNITRKIVKILSRICFFCHVIFLLGSTPTVCVLQWKGIYLLSVPYACVSLFSFAVMSNSFRRQWIILSISLRNENFTFPLLVTAETINWIWATWHACLFFLFSSTPEAAVLPFQGP